MSVVLAVVPEVDDTGVIGSACAKAGPASAVGGVLRLEGSAA